MPFCEAYTCFLHKAVKQPECRLVEKANLQALFMTLEKNRNRNGKQSGGKGERI